MAVFPARSSSEPFVGRARELSIGSAALANEDHLGVVLISGEAGLGKSRLAERLIDEAGSPTLVRAVAVPRPTPIPFELVDGLVDQTHTPVDGGVAERIRAAAETLRTLADGPTVFLFEDVHWADPESLEVIDRLAAAGPLSGSIIITFRPTALRSDDAASSFLRRTERRADAVQLRLEPLRREEVAAYLHAAGRETSESAVDHIHGRTGGNPLLLTELVAATDATSDLTTGVPWTLAELLRPQIDALEPDVRSVAEAVAVLGSATDFDLLAAAVEADEASLLRRLRTLVDLGILAEVEDDHFAFRHDLVGEAVAESLFSRERRRLHELVHDALITAGSSDAVALVTHARSAGRNEAAATAARDAAPTALARGHTHHAFTFADLALEEFCDDAELHRVAVVSGWMTGQARAARQHVDRWEELVGDDPERLAEVLHYRIRLLWEAGDRSSNDIADELRAVADGLPDSPARAQAYADLAQHHMLVDRVDEAITAANRAIAVAEAVGPTAAAAGRQAAVECESARLAIADRREAAAAALDRLAVEAEEAGDHVTASRALHNRPLPADPAAADRQLERMRETGRRSGLTTISDVGHRYYLLTAAAASGDRETYESLLDAALQDFDDPYELTMHAALLAIGDGRHDDAETLIRTRPRAGRSPGKTVRWRDGATAVIAFETGDSEAIRDWIESRKHEPRAAHLINHIVIRNLDALLAGGLAEPIRDTLAALRTAGHGDTAWDAVIAEIDGRADDAEAGYATALASPFARPVVERAQLHLARARVAATPGETEAHLSDAAATLATWPCSLTSRISSEVAEPSPPLETHGLTPREQEVAALVARGLTNGGIAEELFISTKTASVHVSNILSKLGMGNRTEIAAWVAAGSMN